MKMVLPMKVNGLQIKEMVMVSRNGQTEDSMKESGPMIKCADKVRRHTQMVMFIKDNSKIIKVMALGYLQEQMETIMKPIGKIM